MKNADILDRSLMKLEEQTGIRVIDDSSNALFDVTINYLNSSYTHRAKYNLDLYKVNLKIEHDIGAFDLKAVVIPNASKAEILNYYENSQKDNILFVSPYFSKSITDFLIEKKINFIDTAGNTYLLTKGLFFLIKGNKKPTDLDISQPKRLFQETGLKVLFVLLNHPKLINESYRSIASMASVSASSVKYVFEELEELKFLLFSSKNKRQLVRLPRLLQRWSIAYGENLKPKLHRGYFKFKKQTPKSSLKLLGIKAKESYWGGEFAAELMVNYLDAKYFTLYSSARFSTLVREMLIIPTEKDDSELELLDVFWKKDSVINLNGNEEIVSPILIYADLYNSLNERNLDTAKKILENELSYLFQ